MTVTQKAPEADSAQKGGSGVAKLPLLFLVLVVVAGLVWFYFGRQNAGLKAGRILVSGRIEGYETDVGAKIGGKVKKIEFREGNQVDAGALVAELEDDDIQARLRAAQAKTAAAECLWRERKESLDIAEAQIEQARLELNRSTEGVRARIEQNEASKAQANAELIQAEAKLTEAIANHELARKRKERFEKLLGPGAVTKDEYDEAVKNFESTKAVVESQRAFVSASRKKLSAAGSLLDQARADRFNPGIRSRELNVMEKQLVQARHQVDNSVNEVAAARAQEDEIEADIAYLRLLSPINGVVTARPVEPGAVVVPGGTVITLIDLDKVYLRAYLPEGDVGKVRVGDSAEVFLDSFPGKPLTGKVIEIDPVASFTPQNIYFKEDRVKQVFGLKIGIEAPDRLAKPGMPADAEILLGKGG